MAAAVRERHVPPVELVERSLDRLERWQGPTNAFSQTYADAALGAARALERDSPDGAAARLWGVPYAAKDLFDVEGRPTTGCCRAYKDNVATRDAAVVARMREAGTVLVGKANQHELACGATNLISACGPTANPWDFGRITGGSSGGSAAAVAAGIVPVALGSDTGGSVRIPSSFCGVWGLKPTNGALPLSGVMPLAPSMDCPGPLARTATDLRLAWEALSGRAAARVMPRRAGVLGGYFADRIQPMVLAAVRAVADALENLGIRVEEVRGRGIDDAPAVWNDEAYAEFAEIHGHLLSRPRLLGEPTCMALEHGLGVPPERRSAARARVAEIGAWFEERLRDLDLLLAPATPFPAPPSTADRVEVRAGETMGVHGGAVSVLTRPVNLAGLPAVAVPAGFSPEGLPLGVQLIGSRNDEDVLLSTASMLEASDERFRASIPDPPSGTNTPGRAPEDRRQPASLASSSRSDGSTRTEPSGNRIVGTLRTPWLIRITSAVASGSRSMSIQR
jgi:aspartyl-tRNA(Asn)/glutamyl-tRNA(Gln) amidotransferase subunit A